MAPDKMDLESTKPSSPDPKKQCASHLPIIQELNEKPFPGKLNRLFKAHTTIS